ncbi:MAG: MotA/TolQ/ExbB proton channel family protein [Verrucomicrobiota bacterium]
MNRSSHSGFWLPLAAVALFAEPALLSQEEAVEDAEKLKASAAQLDAELDSTLTELNALREKIAEERPPLASRMQETAAMLREKQREYDIARSSRESITAEFEKAEKELELWRDERSYLDGLLFDFRKNYEASTSLAKSEALAELLLAAETPDDEGTSARVDLVAEAIGDIKANASTGSIPGEALGPDGVMYPGQFVDAGPISWFVGDEGTLSGLISSTSDLTPEVIANTEDRSEIEALIAGKSASPTFDPTLGTAVALEEVEDTFVEHILKGGIWIYPILFLAAVSFLVAIVKLLSMIRLREVGPATVNAVVKHLKAGEPEAAKNDLAGVAHPTAKILTCGIEHAGLPREALEEKLYERHLSLLPKLQRGLPFIAIAAATAPLLGLLGTVTGMIHTFQKITVFGTGDAKPLAGGISEALVTTEFGLIVAIPSLIAHALLSRRAAGVRSNMEMSALAFLNGMKPLKS